MRCVDVHLGQGRARFPLEMGGGSGGKGERGKGVVVKRHCGGHSAEFTRTSNVERRTSNRDNFSTAAFPPA